jgi:hypothetical protein
VSDQSGTAIDYSPGAVSYARKEAPLDDRCDVVPRKVPWYRRKWGMIGIVVAVLVIIGGAVGGGVGGTRHSSHPNKNAGTSTTATNNTTTNGIGEKSNAGTSTVGSTVPTNIVPVGGSPAKTVK